MKEHMKSNGQVHIDFTCKYVSFIFPFQTLITKPIYIGNHNMYFFFLNPDIIVYLSMSYAEVMLHCKSESMDIMVEYLGREPSQRCPTPL